MKVLAEGDHVLPLGSFAGTWRSMAVLRERQLLRLPAGPGGGGGSAAGGAAEPLMPLEYAALAREMAVAYQ